MPARTTVRRGMLELFDGQPVLGRECCHGGDIGRVGAVDSREFAACQLDGLAVSTGEVRAVPAPRPAPKANTDRGLLVMVGRA